MNRKLIKRRRRKVYQILGIVFMIVLVAFFLMAFPVKDKESSELENRSLTQRPTLTWQSFASGSYMDQFESYMSDQFAGRNVWRRVYTVFCRIGGSREENDVLLGRKHQLMETISAPDGQLLEMDITGLNAYTENYEDVNTCILLVPDAAQTLKNRRPLLVKVSDQEKFFDDFRRELSDDISWLDGIAAMDAHMDDKLYYLTDHHWTTQGARDVFLETADDLGIKNAKDISYDIYPVTEDFNGTLASTSGFCLNRREEIDIYIPEDETPYVVTYVEEQEKSASVYSAQELDTRDKYAVFFAGNHPLIEIDTAAESDKTLLVIKDSFANCYIPFLIPYYSEIIVADPRYYAGVIDELTDSYNVTDTLFLYSGNTFFTDNNLQGFLGVEE